jgi:hypothetical protein
MGEFKISTAVSLSKELGELLSRLSDSELQAFGNAGGFRDILRGVLDKTDLSKAPKMGDFYLAERARSSIAASIYRDVIASFAMQDKNTKKWISPAEAQWFEDGVVLLEGDKPFEGFLCVYRKDDIKVLVAARDVGPGEEVSRESFAEVSIEDANKRIYPNSDGQLDEAINELEMLLGTRQSDERKYQEWLIKYPWVLGGKYRSIVRHEKLDDKNIPDFSGVRAQDNDRDVFEIEQPFKPVLKEDGGYTQVFNEAWNQAERYLMFVKEQRNYLHETKGLRFENPESILIFGHDLPIPHLKALRMKGRTHPQIKIFTYDDVLRLARNTVTFVRGLKTGDLSTAKNKP